ncbi:MAG TPA: flagellar basal body L-ring protein FlgH [Chromatiales bacterium]|nr:flagellar basal body L-ring protein FlgH [Chromatiales bacterium]
MTLLARLLLIAFVALLLAGCNTAPVRDPAYAPVRPAVPPEPPQNTGSIYQQGHAIAWFENLRARRVGDMLTVKLVERTNASKKASASANKSSNTNVTNPTLLGSTVQFNAPGLLPLASNTGNSLAFNTNSQQSFKGEGDAAQSNTLSGDITVTVIEVLPNGYLMVRGEKRIGINQGNEYVRLSGIVRPHDIDATNSVVSTKLADPTIVYVGDGAVADASVVGWLSRFFVSALFPF